MTEPAPRPSVTTAPAEGASPGTASPRAPLGRRRLPPHLGPARTSTVLLAAAFVAIGVLYLFVKPPAAGTSGSATDPATSTSRSVAPTTSAPASPPPEETSQPAETSAPTSEVAPTTTGTPPEDTEGTVEETEVVPTPEETTAPAPTTSAPEPTTAAPTS